MKKKTRNLVVHNINQICCCGLAFHRNSLSSLLDQRSCFCSLSVLLPIRSFLLLCSFMLMCSSTWWEVNQGRFPALKFLVEIAKNSQQSCIFAVKCSSGEEFQKSQALSGLSMVLFHSNNSNSLGCLKSTCGEMLSQRAWIFIKNIGQLACYRKLDGAGKIGKKQVHKFCAET